MSQLSELIEAWGNPKILVVGDVMLDRSHHGTIERQSQEADIPILRHERTEDRPGGAAAVALMLKALGAQVSLMGLIGPDRAGEKLEAMLVNAGVSVEFHLDHRRRTTVKERFMVEGRQVGLRLDRETIAPAPAEFLQWVYDDCEGGYAAILISDYGKGAVRGLDLRRMRCCPVLVDPARNAWWRRYAGATMIKANHDEYADGSDRRWQMETRNLIVTDGVNGMTLMTWNGDKHFPSRPSNAADPTGCGDQVFAVFGMVAAAGQSWEDGCRIANIAGGLAVERIGCVPVSLAELLADIAEPAACLA